MHWTETTCQGASFDNPRSPAGSSAAICAQWQDQDQLPWCWRVPDRQFLKLFTFVFHSFICPAFLFFIIFYLCIIFHFIYIFKLYPFKKNFDHAACRILAPQAGIKPLPLAWEVHSLNHWTSREAPVLTSCQPSSLAAITMPASSYPRAQESWGCRLLDLRVKQELDALDS